MPVIETALVEKVHLSMRGSVSNSSRYALSTVDCIGDMRPRRTTQDGK